MVRLAALPCKLRAQSEANRGALDAGMVSPNDARKLAWDWLVVCFVVYTTLATPLDLAFFDTECSQTGTAASQAPLASSFQPLTLTCRGVNADPMLWASYEKHRFSLRTACKPAVLEALDNVVRAARAVPHCMHTRSVRATQVDAVFWLDTVLTFCTGISRERECLIKCVPQYHLLAQYHLLVPSWLCASAYTCGNVLQLSARSGGASVRLPWLTCG